MNGLGQLTDGENSLYHWQDVTPNFLDACHNLDMGELLHDDMFGLFEAMSAIEMMDPKMDAGMLCNRANCVPVTWEDAVERGDVDVMGLAGELEPRDITIIVDQTFSCLVTWLEGHSLAQTVMTNLYLHHPDRLQCVVLKAVSVAFLKISEAIKDIISKAVVFEEEDFQPHTYGFRLGMDVTEQRCLAGLREAEELLGESGKTIV